MDDAREIVEYARLRGIHVMPELDVPGHAASWGVGYSDLWPASECITPLDVTKDFTFDVIDGIIGDFKSVFPFKFAHLGGDEVHTDCWEQTPHIKTWLSQRNITSKDAYADFVIRAQGIAIKHGYVPVNWEETYLTFPSRLNNETVVHNWLNGGVCARAVKEGFKCILSDQAYWYLDHLDALWDKFYETEPFTNITDAAEQRLVIGGEVCMWGETADPSNVLQTIWPRAAAAAERLWSPVEFTSKGAVAALKRFQHFRCVLNWRGIAAAPVLYGNTYAYGRGSPRDPGSCFKQ
jgi:hexosaminidase